MSNSIQSLARPTFSSFSALSELRSQACETLQKRLDLSLVDDIDLSELMPEMAAPDPQDVQTAQTNGTLYVQGSTDAGAIDFDDVKQGGLGDCYLLASLAAVANQNPNAIKNAITENRNANGEIESYTVRLYKKDDSGRLQPHDVTVDAKEFSQMAAQHGDTAADGKVELWVKIVEKAYAQANGSYSAIGKGGWPEDATEMLTGVQADSKSPSTRTFASLQADLAAHKPITVWTSPDQSGAGLVGNHAYAVLDTKIENGVEMVKLYNPWGGSHPGQVDAAGDGGWITMEQYQQLLAGETTGRPVDDQSLALGRFFEQLQFFKLWD